MLFSLRRFSWLIEVSAFRDTKHVDCISVSGLFWEKKPTYLFSLEFALSWSWFAASGPLRVVTVLC